MKLCIIYNFAQHYRTSIFCLLDKEFDCTFIFGKSYLDIKKMDYSLLRGEVCEVDTVKTGSFVYRKGIVGLLKKDFDAYIILGETRIASTWLFLLLSRLYPKKKIFTWTHGLYGKETGLVKWLNKLMLKLPNSGNFIYGNYARDLIIKEGLSPERQFTIHNSLAYEEQLETRKQLRPLPIYTDHFRNTYKNLMFVGRLTPIKKLDLLLRTIALCKSNGVNYNLTLIGGGQMTDSLQSLSKELGIENNVWFYGPCYDEKELGELIYNADLCVSPGNVGLTAMHAMVFGCPVLTHNNFPYQMPEFEAIKEGSTGAFFDYDDVESLAASINKWFEEKFDRREDVRNACMEEIDNNWTPEFQLNVIKRALGL